MNKFMTALSLAALMSVPAVAQDTTVPRTSEMPAATQEMPAAKITGTVSASELLNKAVKNATNENVGDINDLQIGDDGKIAAVIVGVGGFLGLGEKDVALPYDQIAFARDADGALIVTANVTKESLQAMPEWKKKNNY
jgi:sporulation protein YlmC with PRC-barrel domain